MYYTCKHCDNTCAVSAVASGLLACAFHGGCNLFSSLIASPSAVATELSLHQ